MWLKVPKISSTGLLTLCGVMCCVFGKAHGSPFLERLQLDSVDKPFAARSLGAGTATPYFHPARIPLDRLRMSAAIVSLYQSHSIKFDDRPDGYDVAHSVYRSRAVDDYDGLDRVKPVATSELPYNRRRTDALAQRTETLVLGLSAPIVVDSLGVALVATLPVGLLQTQRPFFVDERSQFFDGRLYPELYRDRLESSTVALAATYRLGSWLSVGGGVSLANHSRSVPQVYVPDAGDQERTLTNAQIEVVPTLAPFGSINVHPFTGYPVTFSMTVHGPSESRLTGRGQLRFWEFDYPEGQTFLNQRFDLVFLYQPLRAGIGLDTLVDIGAGTLAIYGDLVWSDWSRYRNRHGESAGNWSDTVDIKGGLAYEFGASSLGLGAAYFPTPVPRQVGRTNYVDSARVGTQLGWQRRFRLERRRISIGIGLQYQHLLQRGHKKSPDAQDPILDEFPESRDLRTGRLNSDSLGLQTNNPGFPGYSHRGYLMTGMLQLGIEL
ncbi:MAG: hypothetical protein VYA30_09765 [Myxococcota bacterium]|nr:hypothetical protein [Myxococcota bacterium]